MSLGDCNSATALLQGSKSSDSSHPLLVICSNKPNARDALFWLLKQDERNQDEMVPEGYVSVQPTFLPKTKNGGPHGERGEKVTAIANLPHGISPIEANINKMIALQDVVSNVVRAFGQARLSVSLVAKASELGLKYQGSLVSNWKEVRLAYCNELTTDILEILYEVLYGQWYANHRAKMDGILNEILKDLKLHVLKEDQNRNQGNMSDKNSFHHVLQNKFRDSFRNNLFKKNRCIHGVKLTVTQPKGQKWMSGGKFRMDYHVKGWNGEAHQKWLKSRSEGQSLPMARVSQPKLQKRQWVTSTPVGNVRKKSNTTTKKPPKQQDNVIVNVVDEEDGTEESDLELTTGSFGGQPDTVSLSKWDWTALQVSFQSLTFQHTSIKLGWQARYSLMKLGMKVTELLLW